MSLMDFVNQKIYNKYKKASLKKKNHKKKEIGFFYLFLKMLTSIDVVLVNVKIIWVSLNKKMNK